MSEPIWVPVRAVQIIHHRQIVRHGGASGLRDEGLPQNALQRPVNKWQYEGADIFECAATYAFGIAKAHAFVDGNKRTAFVTSATFLRLNGWHFVTEPAEGVAFMEGLASDDVAEENSRTGWNMVQLKSNNAKLFREPTLDAMRQTGGPGLFQVSCLWPTLKPGANFGDALVCVVGSLGLDCK